MNSRDLPYLLCEVANVHGGDGKYLNKLILEYKKIPYQRKGIKFQVFKPDTIALPDFEWYPVYEELFFNENDWLSFIKDAETVGDVWIDVFDVYSIEILNKNIDSIKGIKLQASVLQNQEVFEALSQTDLFEKIIIINVSGFDVNQVALFVERFSNISKEIVLQIGYQSYPTEVADTGLQKISVLKAAFPNLKLCIADHADATSEFALRAPIYGVLLGCEYIEKHICLSRDISPYDKYSALEPEQIKLLCHEIDNAHKATIGRFIKKAESDYLNNSIQVPVLKRDVKAGELLSYADFVYRRTAQSGLSFDEIKAVQGKKCVLNKGRLANSTIKISDYSPAKIAVIVACRMKSTRLPKKAILPIVGVPSVELCLKQCTGINGVDNIILATSDLDLDDELVNYTLSEKAVLWRGDPDDVISRYLGACEKFNVNVIVRITADCPLIIPDIIECLLDSHFETGADYTAASTCAVGSSGEIINVSALKKVAAHFGRADYSEYMTWYFQNNPDVFKINLVDLPDDLIRPYRMTLDYPEDLEFFNDFYSQYYKLHGDKVARAKEVFEILDSNPQITSLNSHLTLKYKTDKELIDVLNKKTKIYFRNDDIKT